MNDRGKKHRAPRGTHGTGVRNVAIATVLVWLAAAVPAAIAQSDLDFLFDGAEAEPAATPEPTPAPEAKKPGEEPAPAPSEPQSAPPPEPALARPELPEGPAPEAAPPPAAPRSRTIEEIVVTAQKREQAIEDVPISMSALTAETLVEQGVTDIREALQLVPNASIDSAGFFAAPRMRGFTFNNNNKSFEPPVGIVLDGIPHTRVEYFNAAVFDVRRMEVLRGPQGTTFGKNTTAGLIHVISNGPTDELEGFASLDLGELDRRRFEAAVGGPLWPDLVNVRVAGLLDERDGYIRNTTAAIVPGAPRRLKDRDRTGVRAILGAPNLLGSSFELAFETFELFDGGAALEAIRSGPTFEEAVRDYDPNADFIPGNWVHSQEFPDFRDISIWGLRGKWETDLLGWDVVGLGSFSEMKQDVSLDTDFTAAPAIFGTGNDRSPVSYAELRFVAPTYPGLFGFGGLGLNTDFLVGATWSQREILDSDFIFGINNGPFFDLVGAAAADAGLPAEDAVGGILGAPPFDPAAVGDELDEFNQQFEQSANDFALFAHTKWQFLSAWALELGGRLTHETKTGDWNVFFTTPPPNPSLEAVGVEEFQARRKRIETNFQPKVSLNWQPLLDLPVLEELGVFAHWEQGFKGGGFNAFAFREGTDPVRDQGFEDDDLEFEDEVATNWGLDVKTTLLEGVAKLNFSLFRQTATDFQVLIRENPPGTIGLGTSRVVNAEKALAQGFETDLMWLVADWLTLTASSGLLDTEFIEFADGECPVGMGNTDGDENPRCDQSGRPFPFAPLFSNAFSARVTLPFARVPGLDVLLGGTGLVLSLGTLVEHEASQILDVDLDERKRQDAYFRYRADFGIRHPAGFSLRLIGENLSNTVTHVRYGDIFADQIVGSQNQPRLWYLQMRQEF